MSLPAIALRVNQIGAETTPGTAVPATKRPRAAQFTLQPGFEGRERVTQIGSIIPGAVSPGYEWCEGDLEGQVNFPDLAYVLAATFGDVTATQVMDGTTGTGAYRRQWSLSGFTPVNPKTLTVEAGIPGGEAIRAAGVVITELEFSYEPGGVEVSGSLIGNPIETGVSLTANPTTLDRALADPKTAKVYLAATPSGLDSAQPLANAFSATVNFGEQLTRVLRLGATNIAKVPQAAEPEFTLTLATDSAGIARINELRQNTTVYARITVQGPIIYDGASLDVYHSLSMDLALQWLEFDASGDQDGVWVVEMTGAIVEDSTLGGYAKITLTTTVNTL